MRLRVVLSVAEIVLLVAVLAYFLRRLTLMLAGVAANLEKIAGGVRAVEDHCTIIGPGVEEVNGRLAEAAAALEQAGRATGRLRGAAGTRA